MRFNTSNTRLPSSTRLTVTAARLAEEAVAVVHEALGRAELRLHAWRMGHDPETRRWVKQIEHQGADGTLVSQVVERQLLQKYIDEERNAS